MFEFGRLDGLTKSEFYDKVVQYATHLIEGEHNDIANLSNLSALLNECLGDINWVGFYLWSDQDNELILGPFQGKSACIRIKSGRGVCGTAVATGKTQVVQDVLEFPGHIACDAASRSEIVIPLYQNNRLIGVLDIDSPVPNRFDDEDAAGLAMVMDVLIEGTHFRPN